MPRGNDAEAAAKELYEKYELEGNAEYLIQANRARVTKELKAASKVSEDTEATAALDLDAVAKAAGLEPHQVTDARVRGKHVVFTYEDDAGAPHKDVVAFEPPKGRGKAKVSSIEHPVDDEVTGALQEAARERRLAAADVEKAAEAAREDAAASAQERAVEADKSASKRIGKAQEDAQAELDKKAEAAKSK